MSHEAKYQEPYGECSVRDTRGGEWRDNYPVKCKRTYEARVTQKTSFRTQDRGRLVLGDLKKYLPVLRRDIIPDALRDSISSPYLTIVVQFPN